MKRTDSWCIRPDFLGFVSIWGKEPVAECRGAGSAGRREGYKYTVCGTLVWLVSHTCTAREPHLRYICSTQVSYKRGISTIREGRCIIVIFSALFCFLLFRAEA